MNLLVAFLNQKKKVFGPFIAKRKLVRMVHHGWKLLMIKISNLFLKIARLIDNQGTFNIQLKNQKNGPVPFEFNPISKAQHQLDRISVSMSPKCLSNYSK